MATPSRPLPSIVESVRRPPCPPTPEVPLPETSKPASWFSHIVHADTVRPSAPQSEIPKRLSTQCPPVILMPRGGGHLPCCSSRKMPFVALPVQMQSFKLR